MNSSKNLSNAQSTKESPTQGNTAWWVIMVMGVASLLLGFLVSTKTADNLVFLIQGFGIFWLLMGILSLVMFFSKQSRSGLNLAAGFLGILAGLLVVQNLFWTPLIAPNQVVVALGVLGLLIGAAYLLQAFLRKDWGAGIVGLIGVLYGGMLIINSLLPFKQFPTVLSLLGMLWGIAAMLLAYQIRYSAAMQENL